MNILIISRALSFGGAEKTAVNLANQLAENGHQVFLCVLNAQNQTYGPSTKVTVIDLALDIFEKKNPVSFYFQLLKQIRRIKKREAIQQSISFLSEPDLANVLTKQKGENTILSIRNKQSMIVTHPIKKIRDKYLYRKADVIVALSQMVKEDLANNFACERRKVEVIYNFSNEGEISQKSLEQNVVTSCPFFDGQHPVFINVGRLTHQKGQDCLIKAFKKVHDVYPEVRLVILGQGELEPLLKNLIASLQLEEAVQLLGFQTNPYPFIKQAKAFVFSSVFEGLGNVLVETLVCGTPIISTDCDAGPREILAPETEYQLTGSSQENYFAKYGILVPCHKGQQAVSKEKQIHCLAEAMKKILADEELYQNYREKLSERSADFADGKIVAQWEAIMG